MNLAVTIEIHGGGPGSGCHGDNCGRPIGISHKTIGDGVWGYSHSGSYAITGESAKLMGVKGYRFIDPDKTANAKAVIGYYERRATKFLTAIANDAEGSEEPLFHSFENVKKLDWQVGKEITLPLTATSGDREGYGYALRLDPVDQRGEPTMFTFPAGTPMAAYGKWKLADAKDFGHRYSEAIIAGKFKITGVSSMKEAAWRERDITVVHLVPTKIFDPTTKMWRNR